jgi:glutamyl-tRNA synthetase
MRNYLARLGWSHADDEFFTDEQALEWFDLDGIKKAPARFDTKKLTNLSGLHIARMDDAALVTGLQDYLTLTGRNKLPDDQAARLESAMYCLKERAKTYPDIIENAHFILTERPIRPDERAGAALDVVSRGILQELTPHLQNASWERDALEGVAKSLAEAHDMKLGKLAGPLRAALAGRTVSPSVFDMMLVLGREETLGRLADASA